MPEFDDFCRDKATEGDGQYAIAYALMQIYRALDKLGLNNEQLEGPPGTTEKIAMELKRIADVMGD
jgi:hypothetical protein